MNSPLVSTFKGSRLIASNSVSSNYTFDDVTEELNVDASSGPITITLPLISANLGRLLTIRKTDASSNAVIITPTSPNLYQGLASVTLTSQYQVLSISNNGTQWLSFSSTPPSAGAIPDSTGTPGNVTQNDTRGRVAIAAGTISVTVTNSNVVAGSVVHATLQSNDSTMLGIRSTICASGSFTIYGSDVASATTNVAWTLER